METAERCARLTERPRQRQHAVSHAASRSLSSSACLRSGPQRYPESVPPLRITRWHGVASVIPLAAQASATARGKLSGLVHRASSA